MSDSKVTPVNPGQNQGNWNETKDKQGNWSESTEKQGSWSETKEKLRTKFPTLMDSDLRYEKGKKDEMFTKVQDKLGKTREELNKIIAEL